MLPKPLHEFLIAQFGVFETQSVSGGCINNAVKISCQHSDYFLKYNKEDLFPGMFEAEAHALRLLATTKTVNVPEVVKNGNVDNVSYLLLQFIEAGASSVNSMRQLGRQLAAMHKNSAALYGLEYNNYIGSLQQCNKQSNSWADFLVEQRLNPLLQKALAAGLLNTSDARSFELLFSKMNDLFPREKPALLHGDLWSGNYLIEKGGKPYLIDPAVYYGNREMDIAMSLLFGGFSTTFYDGYEEVYPLQNGWKQRINLCNLYPLLVDVNLFGRSYIGQLRSCLNAYL
ncbi:MAG: fructosamine kinase family protein [Chitinophagales bacterium]|nr:fructosamine kinase family protein [Chitinophagales bacterium]